MCDTFPRRYGGSYLSSAAPSPAKGLMTRCIGLILNSSYANKKRIFGDDPAWAVWNELTDEE